MKKLAITGAAALLACSSWVHAQDDAAGCGIGAEIMKDKSGKGSQIVAAILNNFIISPTFFMTTGGGLLGCDPTQTVQREEITEIFVASNMDQLSSEAARGGGDYLEVLAHLMGIEDSDRESFQRVTQSHYDELFLSGADAKTVMASFSVAMMSDNNLAKYAVN